MNRKSLAGLIFLNLVLIVALGFLVFASKPAAAQLGGGRDYIMVAGKTAGKANSTVYITNLTDGSILAVTYDQNRLSSVAYRDIVPDFQPKPGK